MDADSESLQKTGSTEDNWLVAVLKCLGPGLMLGLANSNAGDLLAAAQSGAQFRFLYLTWVALLSVPLYMSCELVTRVCVLNNKPLLVMINDACGTTFAVISMAVLVVSCMGGLLMQTCTFVAVGEIWNIGGLPVCLVITAMFVSIVLTDSVSKMEKVGICLGLFEVSFCVSAFLAKPNTETVADDSTEFEETLWLDHATITGAIIGAVLMPWMFFYLGSAVNRNKITECHLNTERLDLALGTFASQGTMGGILVTFAVALPKSKDLYSIPFTEIPSYLSDSLPHAKFLFSMGMIGASFVASLAIALTISWALEETIGMGYLGAVPASLEAMSSKLGFTTAVVISCMLSLAGVEAISMIIFCDVVNSLTVLFVIVLVLYLGEYHLPQEHAIVGARKVFMFATLLFMGGCGLVTACLHVYSYIGHVDTGGEVEEEGASLITPRANDWRFSLIQGKDGPDFMTPFMYLALAVPMVIVQFAVASATTKERAL